jgi:hypothetical protein
LKFEILSSFDNFMGDKSIFALELGFLAFNIKKWVCGILDFIFIFLRKYEEKKVHNMSF